jgi:NAD(P)-dependent dehydrogenase (short-subunit alcohol dehydrogenase family)
MTRPLDRCVAFVTGAGRGLGQAMVEALADAGAAIALAARSHDQIAAVAQRIIARGGQAIAVPCDVLDAASVQSAVDATIDAFGPPDIVVNNAGVQGPIGPIGEVDPALWWQAQAVHVLGAVHVMDATLPTMVARGAGRIINIASQAGTFVAPNASAYAVAKASLIRLTEHVDAERRAQGIRAFAIQPGTILTAMSEETLASPDARRHAAPLVALLQSVTPQASDGARARLQALTIDLASGRFDALAGRYLDVDWDLAAMLEQAP